jgi:hypothetical protein
MRCPLWCGVDVCGAHCGVEWMYPVPTVVWSGCMRCPLWCGVDVCGVHCGVEWMYAGASRDEWAWFLCREVPGRQACCMLSRHDYTHCSKTWEKFSSLSKRKVERIGFKSHVRDSRPHISRFRKALKNYPFFDSAIGDHPQFSADCCGVPYLFYSYTSLFTHHTYIYISPRCGLIPQFTFSVDKLSIQELHTKLRIHLREPSSSTRKLYPPIEL